MRSRSWFPDAIEGRTVVLRRHVARNVAAFTRWYADPEVARLTRYQDGPMRPEEVQRFFEARVAGAGSLALAIHLRGLRPADRDLRLQPARRRQRLGPLPHHHRRARLLGPRLGTEATALMLEHAFGTLGLHRVGLAVFAFNERAIRAYRKVGFVVEGRSREAIWRDGRFFDEIQMSILEHEWRAIRGRILGLEPVAVAGHGRRVGDGRRAGSTWRRSRPSARPGWPSRMRPWRRPAELG